MEDEQILELYFARNEQALAETDRKYGSYCYSLANSILQNQQDAEETVSDTYMKAWNSIPPKRPDIFKMFLAKITRNLAFSRWRQYSAEKRGGRDVHSVGRAGGMYSRSRQCRGSSEFQGAVEDDSRISGYAPNP